jgi:hypothetical protein
MNLYSNDLRVIFVIIQHMEYPYQIVTFFDREPDIGDFVYQGDKGWYPQVALKRRFNFDTVSEQDGLMMLEKYLVSQKPFSIHFGRRFKPEHMPVSVIEVSPVEVVKKFHQDFIRSMDSVIISKFPDREDNNYYPHMTVTWEGAVVVMEGEFENQIRKIDHVWVLKDDGEDSRAFKKYKLS